LLLDFGSYEELGMVYGEDLVFRRPIQIGASYTHLTVPMALLDFRGEESSRKDFFKIVEQRESQNSFPCRR